ncbi:sulfur carrier protein ThiS [Moorella sp. Hama-1]|uniref:sulfur carrier protein ThiS n=1 Tax=Moorella sp. Hama-1 TaxID=2138101 RepID=UPI000D655E0A|nr:sulfur carrier protein ThiS [Moorella sp. Hama-1]BCV20712.1 thiamine biosynthesis protein ThiS [Moorella sp. Hama-1]
MQIILNGREEDVPDGITVERLLNTKSITSAAVVVAVNSEVVAREAWHDFVIKEKDQVEVIRIVGGG